MPGIGVVSRTRIAEIRERAAARRLVRPRAIAAAKQKPYARFETFVEMAGFTLDDWQEEAATSDAAHVMLNCSRQAGKSTGVALMAAHTMLMEPGTTQIVTSGGERQAKELLAKTADAIGAVLGSSKHVMQTDLPELDSATMLQLKNGARFLALPGSSPRTIRSFACRRVIVDEAAFTTDLLIKSIRPMLAVTKGQLVSLSTPNGKQGWFYTAWKAGEETGNTDRIHRIEVPWWKVDRIDRQFIEEERIALGELFPQEYECQFLESVTSVFRDRDIELVVDAGLKGWDDL